MTKRHDASFLRKTALEHGLSEEEYDHLLDLLDRLPTYTEVGVVSVMWSEHCSYKSSRVHLATLPTKGPQVVQGPGENAGAVDIGDDWVAVFKMESHNHPSFIEPFEGAATGVGGILRDVFTMGARPVASLNSLRFGAIDHPKTSHLFHGVVSGIAHYGNCIGVPTVGGEIYFDPCYNGNILVNVFNVGVCKKDQIFKGIASGVGNPVFYVGNGTGRDGIHGATMASATFEDEKEAQRPTVQVSDPFREKLLLEACLELMATDAIVGIQDMGAAGLTSSSVEMAERGGVGIELDADKIPMREEGMNAYEVLLSESQERMLIVIKEGKEDLVAKIFDKWELEWGQVGQVIEEPVFRVKEKGKEVVNLPIAILTNEAPKYDRPSKKPTYLASLESFIPRAPEDLNDVLLKLVSSPNLSSRRAVYTQFDHMVQLGNVVRPANSDAAVVRLPQANRSIALSVDCNSRYCYLDPCEGAKLAVAEAARNISATGAFPLGATDCLNFGDPTNPEVMWQIKEAIKGMRAACRELNTPIVSGNVSLYNATNDVDIFPTPGIAMVGVFKGELSRREDGSPVGFAEQKVRQAGDIVALLGRTEEEDIGGSEYLYLQHGVLGKFAPKLNLSAERSVQELIRTMIAQGHIHSSHDCSEGGLGVALAEKIIGTPFGMRLKMKENLRADLHLFAESPSRIVITVDSSRWNAVSEIAKRFDTPLTKIGVVTDDGMLTWEDLLSVSTADLTEAYESGLAKYL